MTFDARQPGRRHRRSRRPISAYTIVEVMMALAVLSVGATGVIAMQKASIIGNVRARDLSTANAIAASWMERLRFDGLRWTQLTTGGSSIGQTEWLNVVGDDFPTMTAPEGEWFIPTGPGTYAVDPGADVRGNDTATISEQGFCTHLKLTQVLPNLIRAEVRVFWLRNQGQGTLNGQPLCSSDSGYIQALDQPSADTRYHFIYFVSGIARNDG